MWFATGVSQVSQLLAAQQTAFEQYQQIEPFIAPLLFAPTGNFVYSLVSYLVPNDSQPLYFEYPSRYSSRFDTLNVSVLDAFYNATVASPEGQTVPFIDFSETDNVSLLVLCASGTAGALSAVSCLRLNLETVGAYLLEREFKDGGAGAELDSFLLLSNDLGFGSSANPQIALSFSSAGAGSFSAPREAFLDSSFVGSSVFSSTPNSLNK